MARYNIRFLKSGDIATSKFPAKGLAVELDGKVVGTGGVLFKESDAIGFANVMPELREHPLILYRCACILVAFLKNLNVPIVAIADKNIPRSDATLQWFGFEHTGSTEHGEVYEWMPDRALT